MSLHLQPNISWQLPLTWLQQPSLLGPVEVFYNKITDLLSTTTSTLVVTRVIIVHKFDCRMKIFCKSESKTIFFLESLLFPRKKAGDKLCWLKMSSNEMSVIIKWNAICRSQSFFINFLSTSRRRRRFVASLRRDDTSKVVFFLEIYANFLCLESFNLFGKKYKTLEKYRVFRGFRLLKQDDYFWVTFDHFWSKHNF